MPQTYSLKSHAKINLTLHLLGARTDGFTELDSVVAKLEAHDTLTLTMDHQAGILLDNGLSFSCNDPLLEDLGEANLVIKGVRSVQRQFEHKQWPKVHVHLEKRLPYQAGIGSGSSNAAVSMQLADTAYSDYFSQPPLDAETLNHLGAQVGSDVPLFLSDASVLRMQGRGERITPYTDVHPFKDKQVVVVKNRAINVSTREAFAAVHRERAYSHPVKTESIQPYNDFERVVFAHHTEVLAIKQHLLAIGAEHALLCGSGSAVFGVFDKTCVLTHDRCIPLNTSSDGVTVILTSFLGV